MPTHKQNQHTRQVDETDLAHTLRHQVGLLVVAPLREDEREDGVGAAARLVHVGGGDGARLVALVDEPVNVGVLLDDELGQVLDVGAEQGVLAHLQVALLVLGVEEVAHALTVDLHVGDLDGRLRVAGGRDALEQRAAHLRDDALLPGLQPAHHRVALAGARLPVGEYADVVAFEGVVEHLDAQVLVHSALRGEVGVACLGKQARRIQKFLFDKS